MWPIMHCRDLKESFAFWVVRTVQRPRLVSVLGRNGGMRAMVYTSWLFVECWVSMGSAFAWEKTSTVTGASSPHALTLELEGACSVLDSGEYIGIEILVHIRLALDLWTSRHNMAGHTTTRRVLNMIGHFGVKYGKYAPHRQVSSRKPVVRIESSSHCLVCRLLIVVDGVRLWWACKSLGLHYIAMWYSEVNRRCIALFDVALLNLI